MTDQPGGLTETLTDSPSVTITTPGAGAATPVAPGGTTVCLVGDSGGSFDASGTATPTTESGNPTRVAGMVTAVGSHPDPADPIPLGATDGTFDASWNWTITGIPAACCSYNPTYPANQVSVWVEFTKNSTVTRVVRNREFLGQCTGS
jgi:hypothetical protein